MIPASTSAAHVGGQVTIAQARVAAHNALPDGRPVFVDVPASRAASIRVRAWISGDPHARLPGSYVFVDRFSGTVLAGHDIRRSNGGMAVASWIRTLRHETLGGMTTRILAALLGLVPALLLTTGVMHWLRRRRGARLADPRPSEKIDLLAQKTQGRA